MKNYFRGWYIKCQNKNQTLALIPAYHLANGEKTCSIQLITDARSWNITFPDTALYIDDYCVEIAGNYFGREGIRLDLQTPELTVKGNLSFGAFSPIRYDIMGPFRYVPFMQCRHSVFSMKHSVTGHVEINGTVYDFTDGTGYIEGDRGSSFPGEYLWTHCFFSEGSVMLSVADIPFCGFHFTGVISVVQFRGKEYRIATYLGARVAKLGDGEVVIKQGRRSLTARLLEAKGQALAAPESGSMKRIIRESAACGASFSFREGEKVLFSFVSDRASFEYEYLR